MNMSCVIGQEKAMSTITKAIKDGRKHHAWIFCGPRGVGKFTAAVEFASKIIGGVKFGLEHPDIHIICKEDVVWSQNPSLQRRKQTNIPVDLLRERIVGGKTSDDKTHESAVFKTPVLASNKVFIIDEAELLDEQGQNSLLKTLEEPPLDTTIILVTSRDDLLLPTIQSRCTSVSFSPLSDDEMRMWSENINLDVSPSDLSWAIQFSGGSPGLVFEAIETNLSGLARSISDFLGREKTDNYSYVSTLLVDFVESTVSKKLKQNSFASKEQENRRAVELLLCLFSASSQNFLRSEMVSEGVSSSFVISDIEGLLSTNISMKVLVESLCARWVNLSAGDTIFV
jgi:DNA polymerase-3 subunit delta'